MPEISVKLENVSKYYKLYDSPEDRLKEALHPFGKRYHKDYYALKKIDLEIPKGEILGVVGKNGSGKSTLLKLITGVLSPNSGQITVNGKISAILELGSGFNPEFTGVQNIYFYGSILGFTRSEMDERMETILSFADIGEFIKQPLKTYSSGMKARLGFAVAINIEPEILILDEVLAVGDSLFKRKCYVKMEEFFSAGKTIIYVSHDINSINRLCTRAIFIDSGSFLMDANAKLVTTYYQKYLFATDNNRENVRNEILELKDKGHDSVSEQDRPSLVNKEVDEECFLPGMVSKTKVEQRNHDVLIEDVCLKNNSGEKVNVLKYGNTYHLCYKVYFNQYIEGAITSFAIRSQNGVLITSAASDSDELLRSDDFKIFDADWYFACKLMPGIYYINIGIRSVSGWETGSDILNRIVDVVMFKVIDDGNSIYGGLVGLDQQLKLSGLR